MKNPPGRGGHAWGREAKIGPVAGMVPPRSSLGGIHNDGALFQSLSSTI